MGEDERIGEDGLLDGVATGNARFLNQPSLSLTVEAKEVTDDWRGRFPSRRDLVYPDSISKSSGAGYSSGPGAENGAKMFSNNEFECRWDD